MWDNLDDVDLFPPSPPPSSQQITDMLNPTPTSQQITDMLAASQVNGQPTSQEITDMLVASQQRQPTEQEITDMLVASPLRPGERHFAPIEMSEDQLDLLEGWVDSQTGLDQQDAADMWGDMVEGYSGQNAIIQSAEDDESSMSGHITYVRGPDTVEMATIKGNMAEGEETALLRSAARVAARTLIIRYARFGRPLFYLTAILGFADGSWRTVRYGGRIDMRDYNPGGGRVTVQAQQDLLKQHLFAHFMRFMAKMHYEYSNDIGGGLTHYVIGIHNPDLALGGCSNKAKAFKVICNFLRGNATYSVAGWSYRSRYNNCGIVCLLKFWNEICKGSAIEQPTLPTYYSRKKKEHLPVTSLLLKKELTWLGKDEPIGEKGMEYLGKRLGMRVTVKDFLTYNTIFDVNTDCKRQAILLLRNEHYLLCHDVPTPGTMKNYGVLCKVCGKEGTLKNHKCKGKTVKRFRVTDYKVARSGDVRKFLEGFRKREKHWMVHGPGGTGKSHLIRELVKSLNCGFEKEFVVLGTTGVASLNVSGRTIHSFFCLGNLSRGVEYYFNKLLEFEARVEEIKKLRFLLLEEVSMMTPQLFMLVNEILQRILKSNKPFAGVRLCMFGDFLQLPPIPKDQQDKGHFIFETELWNAMQEDGFSVLNMTKGYRYLKNPEWFALLQRARKNHITEEDDNTLASRVFKKSAIKEIVAERNLEATFIYTKHRKVNRYNKKQNDKLPGEAVEFSLIAKKGKTIPCRIFHRFHKENGEKGSLFLKPGSQVMMTSNSLFSFGVANGSRGVVTSIEDRKVNVDFENAGNIQVSYEQWEGDILYMPLILSWAITAHKAQGKSLSCVVASLDDDIFVSSQAYVIISRCCTLENLFLLSYNSNAFDINPRALHFSNWLDDWKEGDVWKMTSKRNYMDNMMFREILTMRDSVTSCLEVQPKAPNKGKILQNILFYDFETYFRSCDYEEEREVPYFNYMEHYYMGKLVWKKTLCYLCDTSIDVKKQTCIEIMERVIKCADLYNKTDLKRRNGMTHMTLCAYNGGGFDFHFLLSEIIETDYSKRFIPEVTVKGTKIVSLNVHDTIGQRTVLKTHDLLNICPATSLANAAKTFIPPEKQDVIKKGFFPHDWCTSDSLLMASRAPYNHGFNIDISYFPKKEHRRIIDEKVDIRRYKFHKNLHDYGPNDVLVMRELYLVFEEMSQKILKTSLLRFITLSKMTWYGLLTNLDSDFLQKRKEGRKKVKTLIHRTSRKVDKDMYQATYGAKCFPRATKWVSNDIYKPYTEIKDAYIYFDVKSMYVSVMMNEEFPYGLHTFHENDDYIEWLNVLITRGPNALRNDKLKHLFIAYCDVQPHPLEVEPPIAHKLDAEGKPAPNGPLQWDNRRRTGWYNCVDLYSLMRNQGKIHKITKAYKWEFKGKLFSKWVTKTFKGKQEAKEKARKKFFKTLGNACYGSCCQAMFDDVIRHVQTPDDLNRFHRDYEWQATVNFEEVVRNEHNLLILKGRNVVHEDLEFTERPRYLGGFILAYSKIIYDNVYSVVNPYRREGTKRSINYQIPYGDTDSFLIHLSRVPALREAGLIGLEPGQICDDLIDDEITNFAKIVDLETPGAKSYGLRAVFPDSWRAKIMVENNKFFNPDSGRYDYKGKCFELTPTQVILDMVKIKGIIQSNCYFQHGGKEYNYLDLDILRKIRISTDNGEVIKVVSKGRFLRNGVTRSKAERARGDSIWKITRRNLERTFFKTRFDRRRFFTVGDRTVPHGYDDKAFARLDFIFQMEAGIIIDSSLIPFH